MKSNQAKLYIYMSSVFSHHKAQNVMFSIKLMTKTATNLKIFYLESYLRDIGNAGGEPNIRQGHLEQFDFICLKKTNIFYIFKGIFLESVCQAKNEITMVPD